MILGQKRQTRRLSFFAVFPIKLRNGTWAWLETVELFHFYGVFTVDEYKIYALPGQLPDFCYVDNKGAA